MDPSIFYNNSEFSDFLIFWNNRSYFCHRMVLKGSFLLTLGDQEAIKEKIKDLLFIETYLKYRYSIVEKYEVNEIISLIKSVKDHKDLINEVSFENYLYNIAYSLFVNPQDPRRAGEEDQLLLLPILPSTFSGKTKNIKISTVKAMTLTHIKILFPPDYLLNKDDFFLLLIWLAFKALEDEKDKTTISEILDNVVLESINFNQNEKNKLISFHPIDNMDILQKIMSLVENNEVRYKKITDNDIVANVICCNQLFSSSEEEIEVPSLSGPSKDPSKEEDPDMKDIQKDLSKIFSIFMPQKKKI